MEISEQSESRNSEACILVVDDEPSSRKIHRSILARQFTVITADSGEEALEICARTPPDLVLLDVEMPGMSGFETCMRIRQSSSVPIIFATGHDSLDEHLQAYDAGGNDLCVKPVSAEILLRKTRLAIAQQRERQGLVAEKTMLHNMAMGFMSSMGESGALLDFTRTSLRGRSHLELAQSFVASAERFGAKCCISIRHDGQRTAWSSQGEVTALEESVLAQLSTIGRQFQFKNRLCINYDSVSVVVSNMPDQNSDQAGRIRDNMMMLTETTEALAENVSMRRESGERAEQMQLALGQTVGTIDAVRDTHRHMVADVRMMLQDLTDKMERIFSWLATDRSQEAEVLRTLHHSAGQILQALEQGAHFDGDLEAIVEKLRGAPDGSKLELF